MHTIDDYDVNDGNVKLCYARQEAVHIGCPHGGVSPMPTAMRISIFLENVELTAWILTL